MGYVRLSLRDGGGGQFFGRPNFAICRRIFHAPDILAEKEERFAFVANAIF